MRLIWEGEKLARSIPQRTARRASRFFSLRLFFSSLTSEDSSPLSLASESGGTFCNFSARERDRTWRYAVEKDAKKGRVVVARVGYERRLRRCEKVEQRRRHRGHWRSGRSTWAILRRVKSSYWAQFSNSESSGPVIYRTYTINMGLFILNLDMGLFATFLNQYFGVQLHKIINYRNLFLGLILNIYLFLQRIIKLQFKLFYF